MNDHGPIDQEKDLMRMWQASTLSGTTDSLELARNIAARVERLDRKVFRRNVREYAAGAVVTAWLLWQSLDPSRRPLAIAGMVAVAVVMIYLWRSHRSIPPLDPAADVKSYHAALLDRYDHQIRLLRRVKYWYMLPLYLWMVLVGVAVPWPNAAGPAAYFLFITLFAAFIVWLNEGYGVRKLREARKEAESMVPEREA
jgi:hypothetical protein